ncbi:hypothetical protein F5884DRAFT_758188 [Xylogone sp. PMI_703]|nr:hypothetical protein F5884DRAFT_758188 [Xylogone sp. PMI_703]
MSRDGPVAISPVGGSTVASEEREKRKSRRASLFGRATNPEKERRKEKRTSAPELMEKKPRAAYVPQHAAKDAMHLGLQPETEPLPVPPDFAPEPHSVPWAPMPISPLAIGQRPQRSRSSSPAPFGSNNRPRSLGSAATLGSGVRTPVNPYGQGESSRSSYGSMASLAEMAMDSPPERPVFTGVRPLSPRTLTSPNWTTQPALSPLSIPSKPQDSRPVFVGVVPQLSVNGLVTRTATPPPADRPIFIGVTPRPLPNNIAPSFHTNGNGMSPSGSHILQPPRPPFSNTPPPRSLSSPVLPNGHQESRSRRTSFNNPAPLHQASPLSLPPITASPSPPPSTSSPPPTVKLVPDDSKAQSTAPQIPSERQPLQHAATEQLPPKSPISPISPIINREEVVSPGPQGRKPNKLKKKRPMKLSTEFLKPVQPLEVITLEPFVDIPPVPRATEDDRGSTASEAGTAFFTPVGSSTHSLKELPGDELPDTPKKSPKRFSPERVLSPRSPKIPHSPASSAQDYAEAYKLAIEEFSPQAVLEPVELDGDDSHLNSTKTNNSFPSELPEKSKRRPISLTYESLQNIPSLERIDIADLIPPPLDFSRDSASSSQSDLDRYPDIPPLSKRHREHARRKSATPTPTKSPADSPEPSHSLDPSPEPVLRPEGSTTKSTDWPLQTTSATSESPQPTDHDNVLEFHAIPYPPPGGHVSETTLPSQSETEKYASAETIQQIGGPEPVPRPRKPNKLHKERRYSVSTQQSNTSSIWSVASSQMSRIVSYIKPRRRHRDSMDTTNTDGENGVDIVDADGERVGRRQEREEGGRGSRRSSFSGMFSFSRRGSMDRGEKGEKRKKKEKREMPVAPGLEKYNRSVDRMKKMTTGIHGHGF